MTNIGLIYNQISWEEKAIVEEAKKQGIKIKPYDSRKMHLKIQNGKEFSEIDLFLQRSVSYTKGLYSSAVLESQGFRIINSTECQEICGNKLKTSVTLNKFGISTPKTCVAFSYESALEALEELGYPAILKPLIGSWGRLVAILKDEQSAKAILESREILGSFLHKVYYLQEFINSGKDIRAFVIGESVVAAMYRYLIPGDWRSNATIGAKAEICEITPEMEDLALKSVSATKGEIVGVDFFEKEGQLLVNEVNHAPGFRHIVSATEVNIPEKIVEYLQTCE
ncbi:MAG: lysine biosynthesis protein LysX [Candidatus Jordarchaeum sp.]|uniref:lysine biosynthesis protein LysX n=1 Tax=Candidatus Jordarchaeum sp. TaxID=2823881 RepID=UPI00404A8A3A